MSRRLAALAVLFAALAGFATALVVAPGYLRGSGFPLDDAWTYAVYARSLAATGRFEFAPGTTLPGEPASPLWASVLAVPHLLATDTDSVVLLVKLMGLALHVLSALILLDVLTKGQGVSPERLLGPLLVALHPDLIAASLSGVEVALATTAACGLLWAAQRAPLWAYGALAMVVPFVRPELAILSLVFPAAMHTLDRPRLWRLGGAGLGGTLAAFGLMAAGLLPYSSIPARSPLSGTPGVEPLAVVGREVFGFTRLLDQFPVADSGLLIMIAAVAASYFALRRPATSPAPAASGAMLGGLFLCAVTFSFRPPYAPAVFDAQRLALPALPLLVAATPILVCEGLRRVVPLRVLSVARVAVLLLLASSVALHGPIRYRRLAADARTVDEVQVAMARTLARGPVQQVVWASDGGGALQYFSRGTVIDLSGANTHALRAPDAQAFLDAHRPDFIEIVAKLSSIDDAPARQFRALSFTATASDAITGASEQRWLVACTDTPRPERLHLGERVFGFRCGGGPRASSMPSALATVTLNSRSP